MSPIRQAKAAIKINASRNLGSTEPFQDENALRVITGPQLQQETIVDSDLELETHQDDVSIIESNDNNTRLPMALMAEVIDEPLMADIVDEEAQQVAARKLLRRRIGIVSIAFLAVLAAVVGGFCGSGKCMKSTEMAFHDNSNNSTTIPGSECRLSVEPDFDVVTTTYRQRRPFDTPLFTDCEPLNGESFAENNTCRNYYQPSCQEPPYKIRLMFSGGGCNQSFGTDGLDFTCQDGPYGVPSNKSGHEALSPYLMSERKILSTLKTMW